MKINTKINVLSVLLFWIIFFQLNAFYLISNEQFPIQFQDMAIALEIVFFGVVYGKKAINRIYETNWLFLIPVLLACTSAIMGFVRYQQPFLMGLRPQRAWIVSMLMYFPLSRVIKQDRYSIYKLLNLVDAINFIYFFLLFTQFIVGKQLMFLNISASQRYGSIRLYAITSFMVISYALHLTEVLKSKHVSIVDLFFVIGFA